MGSGCGLSNGKLAMDGEGEGRRGEERREGSQKTRQELHPALPSPSLLPTVSHFINNAERGAPRCCEVFVNGRANCNKQEWCLSPLTGTTLLIRLALPDGTLGEEGKKEGGSKDGRSD